MPELPEVETVRRGLEASVIGRTVAAVEATGARTVRRQGAEELRRRLVGRRLVGTGRRGKYLAVLLDEGGALVVHLRMSGQLLLVPLPAALPKALHTHVVIGLDDGSELRFVDPRTFGEVYVEADVGPDGLPLDFARLGVDPIVDGLSAARLAQAVGRRRLPVKAALMDQRLVAGIGNMYADEICFRARVRPDRRCESLAPADYRRLAKAAAAALHEAIDARGSSLADARYRDLMGSTGEFQHRHAVYGREALPCLRCRRPIVRTRIAGRSAFYCPHCQH